MYIVRIMYEMRNSYDPSLSLNFYSFMKGIRSLVFFGVAVISLKHQQQQQQGILVTAYISTPTTSQGQLKSSPCFPPRKDIGFVRRASISSDEIRTTTQPNTDLKEEEHQQHHQQQKSSSSTFTRPSSTSSTSSSSSSSSSPSNLKKKKPTLYEILGVSSNATRQELKKSYVALARITHPDAIRIASMRNDTNTATTSLSTEYDFNDIATAYKILSDSKQRKRYDRTIQAEILTEQIATAVQNHPITEFTIKAIGNIAVPFFRSMNQQQQQQKQQQQREPKKQQQRQQQSTKKTPTTTKSPPKSSIETSDEVSSPTTVTQQEPLLVSTANAINTEEDYSRIEEVIENTVVDNELQLQPSPVLSATTNYITAPIRDEYLAPNDIMDNINGRTRKKQQLEQDIQSIYDQYIQIQEQLQDVTQQRINTALHTSNSNLNSNEAYMILNSLANQSSNNKPSNNNALSNWGERLNFFRGNVEKEIESLRNIEQSFIQQQQINTQAQSNYQQSIHDQFVIRQNLIHAERVEAEARRALEIAIENVKQQHMQYQQVCETLSVTENIALQTMNECERIQSNINKQSENVRNALLRKERELTSLSNQKDYDTMATSSSLFPERIRSSNNVIDRDSDYNNINKPEPPMSPASSSSSPSSSTTSSQLPSWLGKSGFQLNSGISRQQREQELQESQSQMESSVAVMELENYETSATNKEQNEQQQEQLKYLRQQEYELKQMIVNMEFQMSNLMDQLNQI